MPSSDRINAAVINRIRTSGRTLTVHYPAARAVVAGTIPGTAPLSPLTGAAPTLKVIPTTTETPSRVAVTFDCGWLDAFTGKTEGLATHRVQPAAAGWYAGAQACARVVLADVLDDATDPYGHNAFTGCDYVEYRGHRYRFLAFQPVGSSFSDPVTGYAWLAGATGQ